MKQVVDNAFYKISHDLVLILVFQTTEFNNPIKTRIFRNCLNLKLNK